MRKGCRGGGGQQKDTHDIETRKETGPLASGAGGCRDGRLGMENLLNCVLQQNCSHSLCDVNKATLTQGWSQRLADQE